MIKNNDNLTNAFITLQKVFKDEKWWDWDWRVKKLGEKGVLWQNKAKQHWTNKMTDPFLSFFSDESYQNNSSQEIVVIIDNTLKTMQEIYDHTGKCIYQDMADKNPIFENSYYFGTNLSAFYDCLRSFFYYIKDIKIKFIINEINENIDNKDIYTLLYLFLCTFNEYDVGDRLKIVLSKSVLVIYLSELDRLFWLDVDENDIVSDQPNNINIKHPIY